MPLHIPRPFTSAITVALAIGALFGTRAVAQKSSLSTDQRIQRVEANLVSIPSPLQFNLQQLMNALNVPGLTVTVIADFKPPGQRPTVSPKPVPRHRSRRKHSSRQAQSASRWLRPEPFTWWSMANCRSMVTSINI